MSATKASWLHILSLYAAMLLTATGVYWFQTGGWSLKTMGIGLGAIAMTYMSSRFRDEEILAVISEIGDELSKTREEAEREEV